MSTYISSSTGTIADFIMRCAECGSTDVTVRYDPATNGTSYACGHPAVGIAEPINRETPS